ncbi:hypothetical protein M426DRAFT_14866 [Hypoxylon sp. CI-4A]|nr:hypothetical protein M426DRAFT_14866 [Hypoxylon sp. CI-4A]
MSDNGSRVLRTSANQYYDPALDAYGNYQNALFNTNEDGTWASQDFELAPHALPPLIAGTPPLMSPENSTTNQPTTQQQQQQQQLQLFQGLGAGGVPRASVALAYGSTPMSLPTVGSVALGADIQHLWDQHPISPPLTAATPMPDSSSPASEQYSSGGSTPSNPRRYYCFLCHDMPTFNSIKDWERHCKTVKLHWDDNTRFYQCRCGWARPRKDHHIRHINRCSRSARNPYSCNCGMQTQDKAEHREHIGDCGLVRRRR